MNLYLCDTPKGEPQRRGREGKRRSSPYAASHTTHQSPVSRPPVHTTGATHAGCRHHQLINQTQADPTTTRTPPNHRSLDGPLSFSPAATRGTHHRAHVLALETSVEDGLALVGRPQLCGVERHLVVLALGTRLANLHAASRHRRRAQKRKNGHVQQETVTGATVQTTSVAERIDGSLGVRGASAYPSSTGEENRS